MRAQPTRRASSSWLRSSALRRYRSQVPKEVMPSMSSSSQGDTLSDAVSTGLLQRIVNRLLQRHRQPFSKSGHKYGFIELAAH